MDLNLESQLGIWLNTSVKFLEETPASKLRQAKNDPLWSKSANDGVQTLCALEHLSDSLAGRRIEATEINTTGQQCKTTAQSLFSFVKFSVVSCQINTHYDQFQQALYPVQPTILDVGCALKSLKYYLRRNIREVHYIGVDNQPLLYPDVLIDLRHPLSGEKLKALHPDVVLALDLLQELQQTPEELHATLSRLAIASTNASMIVFSLPQCGTDSTTLNTNICNLETTSHISHLQWIELLKKHFIVDNVQGIGYLSALPHWLTSWANRQTPQKQHVISKYLKKLLIGGRLFKMFDVYLTQTIGNCEKFKHFSHSVLITATPKTHPRH